MDLSINGGAARRHSLGAGMAWTGWLAGALFPLRAMVGFFAPWQAQSREASAALPAVPSAAQTVGRVTTATQEAVAPLAPQGAVATPRACQPGRRQAVARRPFSFRARTPALRVVQVREAHGAPLNAGRMVISGRMADVCAELDRLVALETQPEPLRAPQRGAAPIR